MLLIAVNQNIQPISQSVFSSGFEPYIIEKTPKGPPKIVAEIFGVEEEQFDSNGMTANLFCWHVAGRTSSDEGEWWNWQTRMA